MKLRRAIWPVLVSVVLVGVLFTAIFPTRTFLAQRVAISRAETQLEVLGEQNQELESRAEELQRDSEIERLAREQYNLVKPGEEAYAVLPPPASNPTSTPEAREAEEREERNLAEKAWDALTGLF